jgi:GxxExxY protein
MLKLPSPLDDDCEALVTRTIGCCIRVHRELGPGLLERTYARAIAIELDMEGIPFEVEKRFEIHYRGHWLSDHRVDVVVADQVLLEIKALDRLAPVHMAQVMSYLRLSGLRVGLLLNFNVAVLPDGLRRVVL